MHTKGTLKSKTSCQWAGESSDAYNLVLCVVAWPRLFSNKPTETSDTEDDLNDLLKQMSSAADNISHLDSIYEADFETVEDVGETGTRLPGYKIR